MMETKQMSNGHKSHEADSKKRSRRKVSKKRQDKVNFVTYTPPVQKNQEDHNVLVTFHTKQQQYAVPRTAVSVADDTNPTGLNKIISTLLKQSNFEGTPPQFDFLMDGTMLCGKLVHRLNSSESTSREGGVTLEYMEQLPPPTPKDALNHDDWVSALHYGANGCLLTGCYDHTIHIWRPSLALTGSQQETKLSDDHNAHLLKIPSAHRAPIKVISWIPKSNNRFISGGMDQNVLVWQWCKASNSVRCVYKCRGHTQCVESLAVSADGSVFATGSWDGALKIWTTDDQNVTESNRRDQEPAEKKRNTDQAPPQNKAPRVTLSEHTLSVSGLVWSTLSTLASCSWDNSVRLWDVDAEKKTLQYVSPCANMAMDSSPLNNTILVTTMDTHVRLLDPRDSELLSLTRVYKHHKRWANSVKWSPSNEQHFATGGADKVVKIWDIRSPMSPLFEMFSHEDKVLALDWSSTSLLFSGSADTNVKMYSM